MTYPSDIRYPGNAGRFSALFTGLGHAFGTGEGRWIKRPLQVGDYLNHLRGEGPGIGIAPLREDNTVLFAAIDLDEPDFDAARLMQSFIPGPSFLERSRSGNAHVWVFFAQPIQAWVAMGVLREICIAAGKPHTEVFPKNWDFARVKLGNYINLPYHGQDRPILRDEPLDDIDLDAAGGPNGHPDLIEAARRERDEYTLEEFLDEAEGSLNDPVAWYRRAARFELVDPAERERTAEFGQQATLHSCAEHLIATAEENPLTDGHRNQVFFMLAKCLTNWRDCDHDEALHYMRSVNDVATDKTSDSELRRILANAERSGYTSTGCDDPLVAPWTDPACPIAHGGR